MEIYISFLFLEPIGFINHLLMAVLVILNNSLLFLAVKRDRQIFRKTKMMMRACLAGIILSVAYFFVPGFYATNVSPEESEILSIFFSLYFAAYMIPYIIIQGVILLIFGIKNRIKFNYFIFVAGLLLTIQYSYLLFNYFFGSNYELYMTYYLLFTVLGYSILAVYVIAYVFLLIQGIKYHQNLFIVLGILMVLLRIFIYFFSPFLISLAY